MSESRFTETVDPSEIEVGDLLVMGHSIRRVIEVEGVMLGYHRFKTSSRGVFHYRVGGKAHRLLADAVSPKAAA